MPPWEKYAAQQLAAPAAGPWTKYAGTGAAAQPQPEPMTPQSYGEQLARQQRETMQRAAGMGVQDLRNLAADVAPMATTALGTAIGSTAGIPGMALGGAAGAAAGGRLSQLLRGDPEPSTEEKLVTAASGAVAGLAGGLLEKLFRFKPDVKLSFEMQTQAKAVDRAFRAANPGVAAGKKGFASPAANELWKRSQVVDALENALRIARDNPDRIRQQFARIAQTNRLMRRLTPEQQALIHDVTQQNTLAGVMRSIGDLKTSLIGGVGGSLMKDPLTGGAIAAGQLAVGAGGRALDRAATERAVNAALAGISGMRPPLASPATGIGALGAGLAVDPLAAALMEIGRQ